MKKKQFPVIRLRRRRAVRPPPGSVPGTVVLPAVVAKPKIMLCTYSMNKAETHPVEPEEIERILSEPSDANRWLDIQGLGDVGLLQLIGRVLGLHPLTVEDIAHTHQRPKVEDFEGHFFVSTRAVYIKDGLTIENEQLSLIVAPGLLVTFQEREGDAFDSVRNRIAQGKGKIRSMATDYLAWALLDTTIDHYFPVLEAYAATMDDLDDAVRANPEPHQSQAIHQIRRELRSLRRAIWPVRDICNTLSRGDFDLVDKATRPAFRDSTDQILSLTDALEGARERASDVADLYMVMMGERTNQVMKVLTIVATIFIPLTFLCGLYGMNFDPEVSPYNMPELKWRYGYLFFWSVTVVCLFFMLWLFRRKGWLPRTDKRDLDSSAEGSNDSE